MHKVAEQDYTPVDAGSLCQPVPSAGTGVAEPIDHRGFLTLTRGCIKVHGGVPIVLCLFGDPL